MLFFSRNKNIILLLAILAAGAGWKALLLVWDVFPFNSDEAIVALMARHILQGARPVFFYGQAYMGSLNAFLVSFGFLLFGEQVWVIRLVQTLLYLATIITTVMIARALFHSLQVGLFAAALMAVPAVNVTLYTTVSLGGYGEALLIGALLILISIKLRQHVHQAGSEPITPGRGRFVLWVFLFGLLTGLGLWSNGLTLVFSAPAGLAWIMPAWRLRRTMLGASLLVVVAGLMIGSAPWWLYAIQGGWDRLLMELLGSAVAVEDGAWYTRILTRLVSFLVFGMTAALGMRPPWEVRWLALPLMPFALAFWLACFTFILRMSLRENPYRWAYRLLGGVIGAVTIGFLLTPFGADPSGRYFLPFLIPLTLAGAHMLYSEIGKQHIRVIVIGVVLVFNVWGTVQCALRNPPGITTQFNLDTAIDRRYDEELMQFLFDQNLRTGYSNYWVSYPLAFLSHERLIFAPRLPYHQDLRYTERDDRYPRYTELVAAAEKVAYITSQNLLLDEHLRREFMRLDISWSEKVIGDYRVFYQLSEPVRPEDVGLGRTRP